jgi:UDP-N-acetylglucosamine acyltransferase
MANNIHPTAIIGPDVKLGDDISIGAYAVIDGAVVIGDQVEVAPHAVVTGWTTIGAGCRIFAHAAIGGDPQDKKHKPGDKTLLEIGQNNIFREFVTINRGTVDGGGLTRIGDNNLFMAYAHVAHDCSVGNDCVFANSGTLAGHVTVEDRAIIGGLTAIHQFCRVGTMAMVGGCSRVIQDVPPYALCVGGPALVYNINAVGLRRTGMISSRMKHLKEAFRILFYSGLSKPSAIEQIEKNVEQIPEVKHLVTFARASERGLCGSAKEPTADA